MQGDGSKWIPCEENLAEQIELGYYKHKPYITDVNDELPVSNSQGNSSKTLSKKSSFPAAKSDDTASSTATVEEKKLEMTLEKHPVEKQWNLLGPYLGQYIVYTGPNTAWLLSASSKIAKSIITRLTNKNNLGGTRLIRGYPEVEKQQTKSKPTASTGSPKMVDSEKRQNMEKESDIDNVEVEETQSEIEIEDYDDGASEEEVRRIDHLVFVIHGVGQKMTEKTGQTFVHDVNVLRKTLKSAYPTAISATKTPQRSNGIQVLPILWRQDIKFGMASDDEDGAEADLGMLEADDGCPTLDELTLEGVPNIRTVVSDVLMDVPLYMTPRYRELMTTIISKEINRVYRTFTQRNPDFTERNGKVTILGHSLGSLLAFDMLTSQPLVQPQENRAISPMPDHPVNDKRCPPLLFPVQNFFAVGSPLGVMLLLRGYKIASRKSIGTASQLPSYSSLADLPSSHSTPISFCYPAVENLYNIFHKSDPVAYRIEPLISRHYSAKLKPEPIPYIKGGLKSMIDAGLNVGSGIANRAGAMYESFKMGITTTLFMRGLGLSRQQIYEDLHPSSDNEEDTEIIVESDKDMARHRSNSDPANMASRMRTTTSRKSPPTPLPAASPYSHGARKLRMLNTTGRVDFCLQEGLLENPYLNAFSAHMQYWQVSSSLFNEWLKGVVLINVSQDLDVAAFLVREIYRE
ncbi:hypothetical protein EC973_007809 [Apophysomyces ossiformis]|uniref:DDHD domain-containing protein n=1 Tax=Apophysomyces ossiformis TaxID=679940 RepID=A0A8H7BUN2_9FUNG|nr:hypothetical protein EC973_007809 [Apophysomyces ossiformis]